MTSKLELTQIGEVNRPKLEPRIRLEDPAGFYRAVTYAIDHNQFNNHLIKLFSEQSITIENVNLLGDGS